MKVLEKISDFAGKWMAIIALLVAIIALVVPEPVHAILPTSWVNPLLGIVMFGMGMTLKLSDFKVVFTKPKAVITGILSQFIIMPLIAWVLCLVFQLPTELAVGVMLVGCCPGGTSSNVMTYLSKGDVALSVGMTACTTIMAPVVTPALVLLLAGQAVDVSYVSMLMSIVQVVLVPIALGFVINAVASKVAQTCSKVLPLVSVIAISLIIMAVVSANAAKLMTVGWLIIVVVMLAYGYFGPHLPGFLWHGGLSVKRLITYSTTNFTGVFGMLGQITANTIILFSLFAGMMSAFGALQSIMNVAMSASGKVRSGGAQVAVISSGLIGSVTGSVAANISMTGSISIPLMKKRGYPPEFAAACEASASTGGAILPPVMNAAAFIIASWTNTPYITIVVLGITPALLYYLGISLSVYIKAIKLGDEKVVDDTLPKFKEAIGEFLVYIIPLVVLVIFLIKNYSAQLSLFFAIITMMVVGLVKQFKRGMPILQSLKNFITKVIKGFQEGAKTCASISVVLGVMGVVVQILTATGLPSKISQFVTASAGHNLFLLGIFVAISCLIFGMGMPAAPAYVLCALLGAPALTTFGVPLLAAHFFVFYYGEMSALTPPVAIGCLVASGMAKADFK